MNKTLTVSGTQVNVTGAGERTIVMLHGWPDTHELWQRQIAYFKSDYRCVSFTMPGFAREDHTNYSLGDVVEKIREVVDAVSPDDKVILLVHDWGCVFGYEYAMRYSDRVKKMIGLDVGDVDSQELQDSLSIAGKLMVFIYQIILAFSFFCGKTFGTPIAKGVAKALQARTVMANVHAGMSMPYAMRWFGVNGGLTNLLPVEPPFPFFYGYAIQKPMMFHSPQWLEQLQRSPQNRVQAFDCGHWLMVDKAEELNASVGQWLQHN